MGNQKSLIRAGYQSILFIACFTLSSTLPVLASVRSLQFLVSPDHCCLGPTVTPAAFLLPSNVWDEIKANILKVAFLTPLMSPPSNGTYQPYRPTYLRITCVTE